MAKTVHENLNGSTWSINLVSQHRPENSVSSLFATPCRLRCRHVIYNHGFQETMPFLSLLLLLGSTSGLRVLDNGLGLPVYGAEDNVVDFASLANDQKADLPSQVAVCSFISYNLNPPILPFPCSMFVRFVNASSIYITLYYI